MNIRTILIMGLLSMLIPVCNAQRILTEQEQADIDTFLYLQAKHETEVKALIRPTHCTWWTGNMSMLQGLPYFLRQYQSNPFDLQREADNHRCI